MTGRDVVASVLRELEVPAQVLSLLEAHASAVARDGDRLGLVSERDLDEILVRHTADSLRIALARRPKPSETWVDVGSGGGFPGLVLACAFPGVAFLLLEPQQRRMGFLELQVLNLGLPKVTVSRRRLQSLEPETADVVTVRALERPDETFPLLTAPLRAGGAAFILAGPETPRPPGAIEVDVRRASLDSPGTVLMMLAT